jgi:hypothetical protein
MAMKIRLAVIAVAVVCAAPLTARAGDLLLSAFGADTMYRYDGVSTTPFATDPDPGGPNAMNGPAAMVYDSSGNLLVLCEFSTQVLKFNGATGAFMGNFIPPATLAGAGGITDPSDMEMGADGNLYIMSHFNSPGANVAKFDATTGAFLGPFATSAPIRHQHGLAFGTGGDLFQGNLDAKVIDRFNGTTGAYLGPFASDPGIFTGDLAFGPTTLYVANTAAGGVLRFSAVSGAPMPPLIPAGPGESYWGILVDSGNLYLSNNFTGTLRKYNAATGAFISDTVVGGGAFDIIAVVPEPSGATMLLLAISARAALRRRRSSAST